MIISGSRIQLRSLEDSDSDETFVRQCLSDWPVKNGKRMTRHVFSETFAQWIEKNDLLMIPLPEDHWFQFSMIVELQDGTPVGFVSFVVRRDIVQKAFLWVELLAGHAMIVAVHPDYRQQGYFMELKNTGLKFLFDVIGIDIFRAKFPVDSTPAMKLLESHGMQEATRVPMQQAMTGLELIQGVISREDWDTYLETNTAVMDLQLSDEDLSDVRILRSQPKKGRGKVWSTAKKIDINPSLYTGPSPETPGPQSPINP